MVKSLPHQPDGGIRLADQSKLPSRRWRLGWKQDWCNGDWNDKFVANTLHLEGVQKDLEWYTVSKFLG